MSERKWTLAQRNAIDARGGTLLIAAAAGSGKTSVLVERVIARLIDEREPVFADRILMTTFSNAAAREMKERISRSIGERLSENPQDTRLLRQQELLNRAQISTIHSFCLSLIREHFTALELTPDFRIGDEAELKVIANDALEQVISQAYTEEREEFLSLVELLSSFRDDRKLGEVILSLHDMARATPFPAQWLEKNLLLYQPQTEFSQTIWGKTILEYAQQVLSFCKELTAENISLIESDGQISAAYGEAFASDYEQLDRLLTLCRKREYDLLYSQIKQFAFQNLKVLRKCDDIDRKELVVGRRKKVKDLLGRLKDKILCSSQHQFTQDVAYLYPKVKTLFDLVLSFDTEFSRRKREKNMVDFSDAEQFAIRLLWKKDGERYCKTALAQALSSQFDEIYVDEYQDTNQAQDMIFKAVSKEEQNLFMVGDVKQSIYKFRQAKPQLFIDKKDAYAEYDGKSYPAKIILDNNFRSRREITDSINFIFSQIMTRQMGEIDYSESESLKASAEYPEYERCGMEIDMLDRVGDADEKSVVLEARHIAKRIRQMIGDGYLVQDKAGMRPCTFGDFCIMLRSTSNKAEEYLRELCEQDINVSVQMSPKGYFAAREINIILSIIKTIDNIRDDIALVSAMMSPVFAFTPREIAKIRIMLPDGCFYLALKSAAGQGDDKAERFLLQINRFRRIASCVSVDRLLSVIYEESGLGNMVSAMTAGAVRSANLDLFRKYARQYEQNGYKGLSGFIRFIDRVLERKGDFEGAGSTGDHGNAVALMSIHHSKGLEFPICFLADSAKLFNREDLRGNTLLHDQMGFSCVVRDVENSVQYSTLIQEAVRLELERSMLSEELRILYVAMTRAKEKLIITMAHKDLETTLKGLAVMASGGEVLSPFVVRSAKSYADWILMALLRHSCSAKLREKMEIRDVPTVQSEPNITMTVITNLVSQDALQQRQEEHIAAPDRQLLEKIAENTAFVYPFLAQTRIPTKVAVTELVHGSDNKKLDFERVPAFLLEGGLTPAQRGTALHTFMQFADYERAAQSPKDEVARVHRLHYLTKQQMDSIDIKRLRNFFGSDLYKRIRSSNSVLREYRFMMDLDSKAFGADAADDCDKVMVQGVADCVFLEGQHAVIVDYKTDYVSDSTQLIERYGQQLVLYRQAIEKSLGLLVGECIIYSFHLGKATKIPIDE